MLTVRRAAPGRCVRVWQLDGRPQPGVVSFDGAVRVQLRAAVARVGFLAELISAAAAGRVAERWDPGSFELLGGAGPTSGVRWRRHGYQRAKQAGWYRPQPGVCSRVSQMIAEEQVRVMTAAASRDRVVRAVCATWFDPATTARDDRVRLLVERRRRAGDVPAV